MLVADHYIVLNGTPDMKSHQRLCRKIQESSLMLTTLMRTDGLRRSYYFLLHSSSISPQASKLNLSSVSLGMQV